MKGLARLWWLKAFRLVVIGFVKTSLQSIKIFVNFTFSQKVWPFCLFWFTLSWECCEWSRKEVTFWFCCGRIFFKCCLLYVIKEVYYIQFTFGKKGLDGCQLLIQPLKIHGKIAVIVLCQIYIKMIIRTQKFLCLFY